MIEATTGSQNCALYLVPKHLAQRLHIKDGFPRIEVVSHYLRPFQDA
jgi:hypothetical protein